MIRRPWAALLVFSMILLGLASSAKAYVPSPQYGAFELKFGPYKPAVDRAPGVGNPYASTFGDKSMFLTQLELSWQFWHPPGFSLGVGGGVGFMQAYAKSKTESGNDSADYTVLNVIPFYGVLVLRVDVLADYLGIPLVPYGKVGLDWYYWWGLNGGQLESASICDESGCANKKAKGGTLGWHAGPGLMFRLDQLDERTARTFDNELGVNHSYLFVEIMWAYITGFGRKGYLDLSTDNFAQATFLVGLALEF
jgi:hypothetical protein